MSFTKEKTEDYEALVNAAVTERIKELESLRKKLFEMGFCCIYSLDENSHDESDFAVEICRL